ncbi:hypothetical protein NT01EI_2563 [Edwardsiella ictaluri 93-146]|uniref:Uncharacterized protein n=1 Tax=Edwardsiella ictaluri (strain 93-146) TaxID=634503 RepID=C5BG09_EDWI9|nr:hypothetical protein NT01EI_2563 [Edwardsiella ictaluri 93-146]
MALALLTAAVWHMPSLSRCGGILAYGMVLWQRPPSATFSSLPS